MIYNSILLRSKFLWRFLYEKEIRHLYQEQWRLISFDHTLGFHLTYLEKWYEIIINCSDGMAQIPDFCDKLHEPQKMNLECSKQNNKTANPTKNIAISITILVEDIT